MVDLTFSVAAAVPTMRPVPGLRRAVALAGALLLTSTAVACGSDGEPARPPAATGAADAASTTESDETPETSTTTTPATLTAEIQRALDADVASAPSIPGEVLFVRAPGVEFAGAAGYFDRERRVPLEPDSGFRVASITKTFTAAAVLRLVEDGRVRLDDPVADHLSARSTAALASDGYDVAAITVRHLLTHTSGLYDYASDPDYQAAVVTDPTRRWTRAAQVEFAIEHGDPLSPPGRAWHYSDTGYVLLGEIIERSTGLPLAASYRILLSFDRLGLDETYLESLEPTPAGVGAPAHQYAGDIDFGSADPSFDLYGGGGLVSTTEDVATFYEALFAGEVFDSPASLATMLQAPHASDADGTGMGIFRHTIAGEECWEHSGFWGSDAVYCPNAGLTIVRSVNQAVAGDFDREVLERRVARIVLG